MATGAAIGITAAATGFQIIEAKKASKAQERAANLKAAHKRVQAAELMKRSEFNIGQLKKDAKDFQSQQQLAFAKGGIALGTGASLEAMQDTTDRLFDEIDIQRREAKFKFDQLMAGADIDTQLGGDIASAGRTQRVGIFLQGASRVASIHNARTG